MNGTLLDHLRQLENVDLNFSHTVADIDKEGNAKFLNAQGPVAPNQFDLIIGADGAYSGNITLPNGLLLILTFSSPSFLRFLVTRENLLRSGRINFQRNYIAHGYKELCIPPRVNEETGESEYALENVNGLHIWPRGSFMLIALPNPDCSFTATLFAPYQGPDGFDNIDSSSKESVEAYFNKYFPDVVALMPDIAEDFRSIMHTASSSWSQRVLHQPLD